MKNFNKNGNLMKVKTSIFYKCNAKFRKPR